jgi:hypothetical protein
MKERLVKLLSVKSIVTLILTIVFAYLCVIGVISGQDFLTIFTVVIAFYFGTQAEKKTITSKESGEDKNE